MCCTGLCLFLSFCWALFHCMDRPRLLYSLTWWGIYGFQHPSSFKFTAFIPDPKYGLEISPIFLATPSPSPESDSRDANFHRKGLEEEWGGQPPPVPGHSVCVSEERSRPLELDAVGWSSEQLRLWGKSKSLRPKPGQQVASIPDFYPGSFVFQPKKCKISNVADWWTHFFLLNYLSPYWFH